MLMHKLGNVVVNNTDNLLISSFVGVISVGIYSNYFLLIGSVRQVLDQIFRVSPQVLVIWELQKMRAG